MKKKLVIALMAVCIISSGCGKEVEPVVDPFANISSPVQPEEFFKIDERVPNLTLKPKNIKNKNVYTNITACAYVAYKDKSTVLTSVREYIAPSVKDAKLIYLCSEYGLPVMVSLTGDKTITKWFTVFNDEWYSVTSKSDLELLYRNLLADPTHPDYPLSEGSKGSLSGKVTDAVDNEATVVVNGTQYTLTVNDASSLVDTYIDKSFEVSADGSLVASDFEDLSDLASTEEVLKYECPVGYSKIKPLDYVTDVLSDESNTISIKGGGSYTTSSSAVAELLTLAYYSGLDVYIKTGDSLFSIEDFILVDNRNELDVTCSAELMEYINARYVDKVKPGTSTTKVKLLAVLPSINLYEGVSDLDAIDKRPFYSYHYVVIEDGKGRPYIVEYTSGTKGIDYLKLNKYLNKTVTCKFTCFILHDADGDHLNYVMDEVK